MRIAFAAIGLVGLVVVGVQATGSNPASSMPTSGPPAALGLEGSFCACRSLVATFLAGSIHSVGDVDVDAIVDSAGTTRLIMQGGSVVDQGALPDRFSYPNLAERIVAAAPSPQPGAPPTGLNVLVVDQYGHVAPLFATPVHGEITFPLRRPIVGIAATPGGYWLAASDGGVFAFGDAQFRGSTGGRSLNQPIVGIVPYVDRTGYWLVASDGGVFTFGSARFHGSTGNLRLAGPVVGAARTPSGNGYWLVAADGGVFSFGDARFYGSAAPRHLTQPAVSIASTRTGKGYWITTADHQIFYYGDAFKVAAP